MSYLALARKWRPRTFSQLLGQEHVSKALAGALKQQRVHHAYLFTGTRGVGKTSVARILAKALNCEHGIGSEPCLECDACLAIEQGRFFDLIEIDGASKTRIEDIRDLLDNVQYAPAGGRFKIFLIDEVHMLSTHSFNALLKTLEEPPAHVKFILATTDPQKLPVTILSRCLQFNLRSISVERIHHQLELVLRAEALDYEPDALHLIAQAARGSMRDALSVLDQVITSCNTKVLVSDVTMLLGYTQQDYALQLIQALASQNANTLLQISQQIASEGGHFQYVLDELLNYFHLMHLYQNIGDENALITPTMAVKRLAYQFSPEDVQLFYQIGLKSCEDMHLAPTLSIGFNMTLLRMLTFRPAPLVEAPELALARNNINNNVQNNLSTSNNTSNNTITSMNPERQLSPSHHEIPQKEIPSEAPFPEATSKALSENWNQIVTQLKLTGLAKNAIINLEFVAKNGSDVILKGAKGHQSLFSPMIIKRIEDALAQYYNSPINIIVHSDEIIQSTPAQQQQRIEQTKQHNAEHALYHDPVFQQIQKEFSAELVKNSITAIEDEL